MQLVLNDLSRSLCCSCPAMFADTYVVSNQYTSEALIDDSDAER